MGTDEGGEEAVTEERRAGSLGELAYNAYREACSGKSAISGSTLPDFSNCNEKVQLGWEAAAAAVVNATQLATTNDVAGMSYGSQKPELNKKLESGHGDPLLHPESAS